MASFFPREGYQNQPRSLGLPYRVCASGRRSRNRMYSSRESGLTSRSGMTERSPEGVCQTRQIVEK